MDRREFLKLVGVASGTSILAGCDLDRNTEKLIPYLVPPEEGVIPGEAVHKPSTCTECPAACGLSVTIKDNRPTKLEGLARHPLNDGALCVRGQASLGRLYHTERIRGPLVRDVSGSKASDALPTTHVSGSGARATWNDAYARIAAALTPGREHVFVSGRNTGTMAQLIDEFCGKLGIKRLPEFELYGQTALREANHELFGRASIPAYRIDEADFLLTVGADILDTFLNPVNYTRQIARARSKGPFVWYHAEPNVSLSGLQATERLPVRPGSESHLLAWLARAVAERRGLTASDLAAVPPVGVDEVVAHTGVERGRLEAMMQAFVSARSPLVISGGTSTRNEHGLDVARLTALVQEISGMVGKTVDFSRETDLSRVGGMADIANLCEALDAGRIGVMIVSKADPVSQLPSRFEFAARMRKAGLVVGIGDIMNPTLFACDVVLPVSHALESWGDSEPRAGLVSAIQPVIEPIHDTRVEGDILLQIMASSSQPVPSDSYQAYVLERWRRDYGPEGAESLLTAGFVETPVPAVKPSFHAGTGGPVLTPPPAGPVLVLSPSLRFYDGRSQPLPLLSEIPDPLSAITWDRWVSVSKASAAKLGLQDRDWVEISADGWKAELPVKVQPGLREDVYMVEEWVLRAPVGWQRASGEAGAYVPDVTVRKIPNRGALALMAMEQTVETHGHIPMEHSPHHRSYEEGAAREDITFFPVPNHPEYRWAMAIDLDLCTGCSACVAACYIENNVPVVGRDQHLKGREQSWITIQSYYEGDELAEIVPMLCQHCDNAPCEPVCPVFAAYHNEEGLNVQVYNRCVGTRYCSNNCPYKVRRFNWFDYSKRPDPLGLMVNPDVSLRGKGIMEKCTFCVQRIRKAKDSAKDENRKVRDGEVVPACAQTCPGDAIRFGNIKDKNSEVHEWAHSEHAHQVFDELGTGPAVYYLKRGGEHNGHA